MAATKNTPATKRTVKRTAAKKAPSGASRKSTNGAILSIAAKPRKKYPVDLVGVRYDVMVPKAGMLMAIQAAAPENGETDDMTPEDAEMMKSAFEDVVLGIFGGVTGESVITRLSDPTDDLDYDHIYELIEGLMEKVSGNPPT